MNDKEDRSRGSGHQRATTIKHTASVNQLVKGITGGDTAALARAITLMESSRETDREKAYAILEQCMPVQKNALRLGITGAPGVGKSTFIEALGALVTKVGIKVAVLAIDPSSSISKGSILGDKTRMQELSKNPLAFIRPSPAGQNLGGVARNTRETMLLCEAAGFDLILVETVGVGQSETAAHSMVDFFLLLQLAGAGDELQGIKRGIVEMADAIVVNKADGDNLKPAQEARSAYERALQLYPPKENGWKPRVLICSSIEGQGIDKVWELISSYHQAALESGYLAAKRGQQNKYWFTQAIEDQLSGQFYSSKVVGQQLEPLLGQVRNGELSPFRAAALLLEAYRRELK